MVSKAITTFIQRFYELSDDSSKHAEYADQFSYGAVTSSAAGGGGGAGFFFQIGPMAPASTREGVLAWREKAWEVVERRKHTVNDVFVLPSSDDNVTELMLYGRVDYKKKDGSEAGATWAGRMVFDDKLLKENDQVKMTHYRVWLTLDP